MIIFQLLCDIKKVHKDYCANFYLLDGTTTYVKGYDWDRNVKVHVNKYRSAEEFIDAAKTQLTPFRLELKK